MSFLSDLTTYWNGNSTLTGVLPASKVYTGLVPEGTAFPYAVITPISLNPNPTTGAGYYGTFHFQISIYHTSLATLESIANTVVGQFDYRSISAATISVERLNGPVVYVDQDTPARVYHCMIEYNWLKNLALPNT